MENITSSKILKLLLSYASLNKLADEEFINKMVDIIVTGRDLKDYYRNIDFNLLIESEKDEYTIAIYNHLTNIIQINMESIICWLSNPSSNYPDFTEQEINLLKNTYVTQALLHELDHAAQLKQIDNRFNRSFESALLRLALRGTIPFSCDMNTELDYEKKADLFHEMYRKNYIYNPSERFAEINSYNYLIYEIFPIYKMQLRHLCDYLYNRLLYVKMRGYDLSLKEDMCPTEAFLAGTNRKNIWESFHFYNKDKKELLDNVSSIYDLEDRIYYGLPISDEEYKKMKEKQRTH